VINKLKPEIVTEAVTVTPNRSDVEDDLPSSPTYSIDSDIPYVDENAVRKYWIDLINGERNLL